MSKKVRLTIGEGDENKEVGEAEVETLPDGSMKVSLTLDSLEVARSLGLDTVHLKATIPPLSWWAQQ